MVWRSGGMALAVDTSNGKSNFTSSKVSTEIGQTVVYIELQIGPGPIYEVHGSNCWLIDRPIREVK